MGGDRVLTSRGGTLGQKTDRVVALNLSGGGDRGSTICTQKIPGYLSAVVTNESEVLGRPKKELLNYGRKEFKSQSGNDW